MVELECRNCGNTFKKSPLSFSFFKCPKCKFKKSWIVKGVGTVVIADILMLVLIIPISFIMWLILGSSPSYGGLLIIFVPLIMIAIMIGNIIKYVKKVKPKEAS